MDFFHEVIEEENAINNECEKIRNQINALKERITILEKSDVFFGRTRKYCPFSNGYDCSFSGTCDHKSDDGLWGHRCHAEEHARKAISLLKNGVKKDGA